MGDMGDMRPQRAGSERVGSERAWMLGFVDLMLLMLTFFILLFAMSAVRQDAWKMVVQTLAARLNPSETWVDPNARDARGMPGVAVVRAYDLNYLWALLSEKILDNPALADGTLQRLDDRLLLSFPLDLLFAPGSATLTERAGSTARVLGAALQYVGNRVEIVGHADPTPLSAGSPFVSNWELSLARAIAMANAIKRSGYGLDIDAYGAADTRFQDLSPRLTEATRSRLARRVDLIIRETAAPGAASGAASGKGRE